MRRDGLESLLANGTGLCSIEDRAMNLILIEPNEAADRFAAGDPRAKHLVGVLRAGVGGTFFVGRVNGPRGKATLTAIEPDQILFTVEWEPAIDPLPAIDLLVGLPRPQTARKILQEATAMGLSAIHFFVSDRGEPSYAQSSLWSSGEWQRHLRLGVEQSFTTLLPEVHHHASLADAIAAAPNGGSHIALDVYESSEALSAKHPIEMPVTLAIGSERGWSPAERDTLRAEKFSLRHLGNRVLRTETACIAALSRVLCVQ